MKKIRLIMTALIVLFFFNMPIIIVTAEEDLEGQSQEAISDEETETRSSITKEDNNIELQIDTGSNNVENSSFIDDFASGDISGQISAVKVDNTSLATGSSVEVKTIYEDNLIDLNDFTVMDSSIVLNNEVAPDATNQILKIDSSDMLNIDLNTGENNFNRNTIINEIETGNIDFAANLVNVNNLINPNLELAIDILNYIGDFTGDIILEDQFFEEDAMVSIYEPIGSTLQTTENVTRNTNFDMITGENSFSSNSYVGDITSGNTNAGYFENDFAGIINKTNFFILNVLGDWVGINEFAGMENVIVNSLSSADEVSAFTILDENQSIESEIIQDSTITANANTGRNEFKENTLIGNLKTGHINLLENVLSIKPDLISLKNKLNIRVINIIGSFFGNLKRTQATDCTSTNSCPVEPDCNSTNTCPPVEKPIEEVVPDENIEPSESNNEVLGVSETSEISPAENEVLGESITINPALIESGSGMGYLLYLLPLIPLLVTIRLLRNPQ